VKIRVLWAGKTKKNYFRSAIEDYAERIRRFVPLEIIEIREETLPDRQRAKRVKSESRNLITRKQSPTSVVLDASGKMLTSEEFSAWLVKLSGDVDFIVGGPAGADIKDASLRFSFGRITLPHELARVVLLEQIFRALAIQHRIPYHK
jgi:23S rRNA (pseudouridine1915-N3)-methyltransferase